MSNTIVLTSTSALKREVVQSIWSNFPIVTVDSGACGAAEQPINSGAMCATLRAKYAQLQYSADALYISIENEISTSDNEIGDICVVRIDYNDEHIIGHSRKILVPEKYYDAAFAATPKDYPKFHLGFSTTIGSYIAQDYPDIDPKNWMADPRFGGFDRRLQIEEAITNAMLTLLWHSVIRVDNFPKPGVVFQDLSDILNEPLLFAFVVYRMSKQLEELDDLDNVKFMGLETRGFIYGTALATALGKPFIMCRKAGKVPGDTIKYSYGTEYSKDTMEVMPHLINTGDRIVIVDDLVATGGSLDAGVQLVKLCGGEVHACMAVLQVDGLVEQAREKLGDIPLLVVL